MVYKLTGPLGPVYLPTDGKIVLGRRTHQKVHRDKFCSRNQIEVVVEEDTVYATRVGVNPVKLTAKTDSESLELKPNKRYMIHLGDTFTLYSGEYPFTLERSKDGEEEENSKRKHDSDDEDEKPKKKVKISLRITEVEREGKEVVFLTINHKSHDENGNSNKKPVCKFGAECYRTNPDHLEAFYHPSSSSSASTSSPSKPKKKEKGSDKEED